MKNEFTPWPRAALAPPHDVDLADKPDLACMHLLVTGRNVILTCDINIELAQTFGGADVTNIGVAAYINTATSPGGRICANLRKVVSKEKIHLQGSAADGFAQVV
jgi:hypothetical protein